MGCAMARLKRRLCVCGALAHSHWLPGWEPASLRQRRTTNRAVSTKRRLGLRRMWELVYVLVVHPVRRIKNRCTTNTRHNHAGQLLHAHCTIKHPCDPVDQWRSKLHKHPTVSLRPLFATKPSPKTSLQASCHPISPSFETIAILETMPEIHPSSYSLHNNNTPKSYLPTDHTLHRISHPLERKLFNHARDILQLGELNRFLAFECVATGPAMHRLPLEYE